MSPPKFEIAKYPGISLLSNADILVICTASYTKQLPGETHKEYLSSNASIMNEIGNYVKKSDFNGITLIASNALCDIMTTIYHQVSGLPSHKIIGVGSCALDTLRLKKEIGNRWGVGVEDVCAFVLGESPFNFFLFVLWLCGVGCAVGRFFQ